MNKKGMEGIVISATRGIFKQYPDSEWDDLISQAWLIVAENVDGYDKTKGASLSTYLYRTIQYKLSDYIRREYLKEEHMNGRRDHAEYIDAEVGDMVAQVEARDFIQKILDGEQGVTKEILLLVLDGYTQVEIRKKLKVSKQFISATLQRVKEKWSV